MASPRLSPLIRRLFRAPVALYRWHLGWMLGHRFLLLQHVGRRTGQPRRTVLEVVAWHKHIQEAVVVSGFGPGSNWLRNIQANPQVQVRIGTSSFAARARVLDADEAVAVIAAYEHRQRLVAPVIRAGLSWILGWRYDGSAAARRRLVAQLPLIAFRPGS